MPHRNQDGIVIENGIGAGAPAPAGAPPLPCLRSNNSTGTPENLPSGENENASAGPVSKGAYKTEFCLKTNVEIAAQRFGIEHLAFFTITFVRSVYSPKLAQKHLNCLLTHEIRPRYGNRYIAVFERHESGAIHFHFVIHVKKDIRTGFDWVLAKQAYEAQKRKDYKSAGKLWAGAAEKAVNGDYLREEWKFWREMKKRYRWVGRCEMLPIRSTAEAIAKYTGGYIAKHMQNRRPEDKGVRLVRYGKGMHWAGSRLAFNSPKGQLWRIKLAMFAYQNGCGSMDALKRKFGPHWAYRCAAAIQAMPLLVRCGEKVIDAGRWDAPSALAMWRNMPHAGGKYCQPVPLRYLSPERESREKSQREIVSMVRKVFGPKAKIV